MSRFRYVISSSWIRYAALSLVLTGLVVPHAASMASPATADANGWFEIRPSVMEPRLSVPPARPISESTGAESAGAPTTPEHSSPSTARVVQANLSLFVGEVKVLGPVSVERVAIGNGQILRAEVLATDELMIIAESSGSTSLRLWHTDGRQTDYNVRVSDTDPETRFHMEQMVHMKVRMVEFRKSALDKLGINWSESINGPTLASAGDLVGNTLYRPAGDVVGEALPTRVEPFSSYFGITSVLGSRIDLLHASGDAVTLAEPVLSCANGSTASFLAGGEVPYPAVDDSGRTIVQFKEYGIRLEVSPRIDTAGNVQTVIDTEISQLDPAVSVQGTPGLLTRRASTAVNVRSGQTIVISGLLSSEQGRDVEALPGLGNLPVLGRFFRTEQKRVGVTELVIFVTPQIFNTNSGELSGRNAALYEQAAGRLDTARGGLSHAR